MLRSLESQVVPVRIHLRMLQSVHHIHQCLEDSRLHQVGSRQARLDIHPWVERPCQWVVCCHTRC